MLLSLDVNRIIILVINVIFILILLLIPVSAEEMSGCESTSVEITIYDTPVEKSENNVEEGEEVELVPESVDKIDVIIEDGEVIGDEKDEETEFIIELLAGNETESTDEDNGSEENMSMISNPVINVSESVTTDNDLSGEKPKNILCDDENCISEDIDDVSGIITTVTSLVSEEKTLATVGDTVSVAEVTITINANGTCLKPNSDSCDPTNVGYSVTADYISISGNTNYHSYQLDPEQGVYSFNIVIYGNNITLDGNCAKLRTSAENAIKISNDNVTIKNFDEINGEDAGIYLFKNSGTTIENNIITGNNVSGIYTTDSNLVSVIGNTIKSNCNGLYLDGSNNLTISENIIINNSDSGLKSYQSDDVTIIGNEISEDNHYGIHLDVTKNTTISDNTIFDNQKGISLDYSNNTSISGNLIGNNTDADIMFSHVNTSLIYNNYFNSTTAINGDYSDISFNIAPTKGTNIVGGEYIAGNYWSNPNGTGFSDDINKSNTLGYNSTLTYNGDYYPLVKTIKTQNNNKEPISDPYISSGKKLTLNNDHLFEKIIDFEPVAIIVPERIEPGDIVEIKIAFKNFGIEDLLKDAEIYLVPQNDEASVIGKIPVVYDVNSETYVLNELFQIPKEPGEYSFIFHPKQLIEGIFISIGDPVEIVISVNYNGNVTVNIKE